MVVPGGSHTSGKSQDNTIIYVVVFVIITLILYRCTLPSQISPAAAQNMSDDVGFKVVETKNQKDGTNEAVTLGEVGVLANNGEKVLLASDKQDSTGKDKVVKQRSSNDYKYYYVSAVLGDKEKAANKLSELNRRVQYLLQTIDESLDGGRKVYSKDGTDITSNMRMLVQKHYNKPLPVAEYNSSNDKTVGSNSDKGMLLEVCLRSKYDPKKWNSDNTLFRVMSHELAHSADPHWRGDGDHAHGPDFFRLQNHLLKVGGDIGVYSCSEYKKSGGWHCGLKLTETPSC